MSTLSSANVTDVNLVLKECTHMRLCINMLIFLHKLGNWLIAYHITEVLIFCADKLIVMGNSKNLRVFNFAILLKPRKSLKFDARKIYMFYSM